MIPYADFARLLADTAEFDNFESYAAECGGSVPVDNMYSAIALLTQIWELGHDGLSIDSLRAVAGITLAELCRAYNVPYGTAQRWHLGSRKPPEWLLPALAYAVLTDVNADA